MFGNKSANSADSGRDLCRGNQRVVIINIFGTSWQRLIVELVKWSPTVTKQKKDFIRNSISSWLRIFDFKLFSYFWGIGNRWLQGLGERMPIDWIIYIFWGYDPILVKKFEIFWHKPGAQWTPTLAASDRRERTGKKASLVVDQKEMC